MASFFYFGSHPPHALGMGPDGRIWVGEDLQHVFAIGSFGPPPTATVTEYTPFAGQQAIGAVATDGTDMFFLDIGTAPSKVYKVTTGGVGVSNISAPISTAIDMCFGPDGNFWIADNSVGGGVYRMTPAGVFTHFPLTAAVLTRITSDGTDLWAIDVRSGHEGVWKVTTAGVGTFYADATGTPLGGICFDGTDIWVCGIGYYGKVTSGGAFTWHAVAGMLGADIQVNGSGFAIVQAGTGSGDAGWWVADHSGNATLYLLNVGGVIASQAQRILASPPDGRIWLLWEFTGIGSVARVMDPNNVLSVV